MRYLLDTHVLLWCLYDSNKLPSNIVQIIENDNNSIYYSLLSVWEVAIKHNKGKLQLSEEDLIDDLEKYDFNDITLKREHILALNSLKYYNKSKEHKDPFDRLLLSQAKSEGIKFITHDKKIADYRESCVLMF